MYQPIRGQGGHLDFLIGPKNTNLVEDIEFLRHQILFSGVRDEVENVSANGRPRWPVFVFRSAPKTNLSRILRYWFFFLVCCGCDTSYIVSVHIQCQASLYTLSLCRGHSWRVRLAKQGTLTPPGHLVSPLVCRGP